MSRSDNAEVLLGACLRVGESGREQLVLTEFALVAETYSGGFLRSGMVPWVWEGATGLVGMGIAAAVSVVVSRAVVRANAET